MPRANPTVAAIQEAASHAASCHPRPTDRTDEPQATTISRIWTAACWAAYQASIARTETAIRRWVSVESHFRTLYWAVTLDDPTEWDDPENAYVLDSAGQLERLRTVGVLGRDPAGAAAHQAVQGWLEELA